MLEVERFAQFFGGKPVGEQVDFAQHDFAVVRRQHIGAACLLQNDQFVYRLQQQGFMCRPAAVVQHGDEVSGAAQIAQRGKSLCFVGVINLRHIQHGKQLLHFQIGRDAHFVRRRVHTDDGLAV